MIVFQENINKPTQELTEQVLKDLMQKPENMALIDSYRQMKHQMAEAEMRQAVEAVVNEFKEEEDYKAWLVPELRKDERRRKKKVPDSDLKRVKLYIAQKKSALPAVIPTVTHFAESTDQWKRMGLWRVQQNGYLSGLAVLDADHVPNVEAVVDGWLQREDFPELGIVWIFITPSGEGAKVVFKAREEWGNLQDNAYQMAETLGVLDYADSQTKNADHAHFLPKASDVKYIDWQTLFNYENPAYEQRYGEAYRRGESDPTQQRWQEMEQQRKQACRRRPTDGNQADMPAATPQTPAAPVELTERDRAIVKALNEFYPDCLPEGKKHQTLTEETSHWLCWVTDNNPEKAIAMANELNWVKNWVNRQPGEVEDLITSAAKKKVLKRTPKALKELLQKAGIDNDQKAANGGNAEDELPFDEWIERIRGLFDVYPCVREICEPHPERLWPFLFFAAAAMLGTDMTLTWFYFYDMPEQKRRLNYNVLGIGDPACGKGALTRLENLLTEPVERADQIANDAVNAWKEEQRSKGANKDKSQKPKAIIRKHGARTSNNVFINDMVNAWTEVQGERMQMHMLTVDTEALNSIKMQKGGSWIDKQVLEIKAWSNEKDNQQYANLDSVSGFFHVFWNLVRTCTPPALKMLANERNFGTGWPTRVSAIPVLGTGFKMIPLRKQNPKALDADETLRQWAYRQDKRRGELPIWPLVEYSWHWTNDHMEIAAFNQDKADELLLKRISLTSLCIAAPYVDMRHFDEREMTGTYVTDDQDKALLDLVIDIQYRTQHYWFGELARNYFDEQMKDATLFRRRTTRYSQCFQKLPDPFTTEQFAQVFGFANNRSANKAINRLLHDKAIERNKRGEYHKRVQNID
jgi:hypothetical protein